MTVEQPIVLRLQLTAIYLMMVVLGSFVMLLVMTFNVGIFFAVCVGQTLGWALLPKPVDISKGLIEGMQSPKNVYAPHSDACCSGGTTC